MTETTMDTQIDWRYNEDRMHVRSHALKILLNEFGKKLQVDGSSNYSNRSIYECVNDWVSQGNATTSGIVRYYLAYYKDR